jgi:ribonucleotide reductase alpha subunit
MNLIAEADIVKVLGDSFVTFNDVKNLKTEEFFNNNQFSIDAFNKKYTAVKDETYVQALKRVCDFVASVEATKELREYWSRRWFNEIYHGWWHPAGSIMQGAGSGKNISLCNCTCVSLGLLDSKNSWDSLEGIIKNCTYTVAKIAAYRQGQGMDFSRLRPRDTKVYNSSQISTGSVHWMQFIDSLSYYVGQKGRIPALLFSLSCTHPDLEEFIKVKSDYGKIQNANISVQCTDAFYDAVIHDRDWELFFEIPEVKKGQKIYVDVHSTDMECLQDKDGYYYIAKRDRPGEKFTKKLNARKILEMIAQRSAISTFCTKFLSIPSSLAIPGRKRNWNASVFVGLLTH